LLVGGAGYIGSHTGIALAEAGYRVVILDDLSSGHQWAIDPFEHVIGDVRDQAVLDRVFEAYPPVAVLQFAARIEAGESVTAPLPYYANNVGGMMALLAACERHGVDKLVFSSTAAVYGDPVSNPIPEQAALQPASPYGATKAICERILGDVAAVRDLRYVALRYFNVAGADPEGRSGESHDPESHLVPIVVQAALGLRDAIIVNGNDYPTADGTCIRDYVHVLDIAAAHARALDYLLEGGASIALNCGYGHGYSVMEIVDAVRSIVGVDFPVRIDQRRAGDVPELVAANQKIRSTLGWEPRHDDLDGIVRSVLDWERGGRLPAALRTR
jgi:UDP-glucose 4-epimerase